MEIRHEHMDIKITMTSGSRCSRYYFSVPAFFIEKADFFFNENIIKFWMIPDIFTCFGWMIIFLNKIYYFY